MTLDDLPSGQTRLVRAVHGEAGLRERLVELGFVPGTPVRVVRRALLGDPLHVSVRAGGFAMRRAEAGCIEVDDGDGDVPGNGTA